MWAQVLENTSAGNFNARPLHFGQPLSDRVDKSGCHYYTSSTGSKFKLLMFERTDDSSGGHWELVLQEDSIKVSHHSVSPEHNLIRCVFICSIM